MKAEQPQKQPTRDRFDCLCECVLIECTRDDERRFFGSSVRRDPEDYQLFKRAAVNSGRRAISADGDCQVCQGSGWIHHPPELPSKCA
ncbi:TPA: hypothetical protein R1W95_001030 [Pseudomonas aeruginosa]|nr:hypothetical protein [Pseudomonas aeruginosa]